MSSEFQVGGHLVDEGEVSLKLGVADPTGDGLFGDEQDHEGADEQGGEREFEVERVWWAGAEEEGVNEEECSEGDEDCSKNFCPDVWLM